MVAVLLLLQLGVHHLGGPAQALQSLVAHVRLNQPLDDLNGLDTDQDLGEEVLAEEAGRVIAEEIGGPLGIRSSGDCRPGRPAGQVPGEGGGGGQRGVGVVQQDLVRTDLMSRGASPVRSAKTGLARGVGGVGLAQVVAGADLQPLGGQRGIDVGLSP